MISCNEDSCRPLWDSAILDGFTLDGDIEFGPVDGSTTHFSRRPLAYFCIAAAGPYSGPRDSARAPSPYAN